MPTWKTLWTILLLALSTIGAKSNIGRHTQAVTTFYHQNVPDFVKTRNPAGIRNQAPRPGCWWFPQTPACKPVLVAWLHGVVARLRRVTPIPPGFQPKKARSYA